MTSFLILIRKYEYASSNPGLSPERPEFPTLASRDVNFLRVSDSNILYLFIEQIRMQWYRLINECNEMIFMTK